jgi:Xaa-Pro aminopeptidase
VKQRNGSIQQSKLKQAEQLLQRYEMDTWLILTREGSDPSMPLLIGVRSVHQAAIFIRQDGQHLALTSVSDKGNYEGTGLFSKVVVYEDSMEEVFQELFQELSPAKLALNFSASDHLCDGLTQGLFLWLEDVIGAESLSSLEISSEKMLKELRSLKTEQEIERIQQAVDLTTDIYDAVFSHMACGMTEIEIGQLFVEEMKKRDVCNGLGNPYDPPLVCAVRNGLAHRKPSHYQTRPGDIVIIDFSVKYQDYVSDIARTCYMLKPGEEAPPEDIQRAFDTAIEAITQSIYELVPGKKGFEVDQVGRKVIEAAGYPTIRHSVGHQVGRATHDGGTILGPQRIPPRPEVEGVIQPGEVYAVEPTVIQDDGLPCILVEENVLVTNDAPIILSKRQTELVTIKKNQVI